MDGLCYLTLSWRQRWRRREVDIGAIYYCGYSGFTHVHDLVGDRPEFTGSNLLVLAINLIGLPLALCDYIRFISNVAKKP